MTRFNLNRERGLFHETFRTDTEVAPVIRTGWRRFVDIEFFSSLKGLGRVGVGGALRGGKRL